MAAIRNNRAETAIALEHMPFEEACLAVQYLARVARKYLLISLSDLTCFASLQLSLFESWPLTLVKLLSLPRF